MIMNRIGKGLVLLHVAISLLALSWAAGLLLQFTDWGWKEPRTDLGQRVPSEYDKSVAAAKQAGKARDLALPSVRPGSARISLREAEESFPKNHLYYTQQLARLQSSPDPIEAKAIKRAGKIVLDTPGKAIGKPVLEEKIEGITKSYDSYVADLKKINEDIDKEVKEIRDWTDKARAITFVLNGKDDAKKEVTMGIYKLLDIEKKAQDQALFEKEYLQPIWARGLQEAELFMERRMYLQKTLDGMKKKK